MKTVRYLTVALSWLLLVLATSHADDHTKSPSANSALRQNKATFAPPSKSSLKHFRNQNPAVIGGPVDKFKNAAPLNGTGMKRQP